jgi:glycosyltransferase involved in cell wall biosynthesis
MPHRVFVQVRFGQLIVRKGKSGFDRLATLPRRLVIKVRKQQDLRRGDLVAIYRTIHFLLIPTRSDTLGLVLLEAAAGGTPAVDSRGTPAADLISRFV